MNYNCDESLWSRVPKGYWVTLLDGMLHRVGEGWVARFDDNAHAIRVLLAAGFTQKGWAFTKAD